VRVEAGVLVGEAFGPIRLGLAEEVSHAAQAERPPAPAGDPLSAELGDDAAQGLPLAPQLVHQREDLPLGERGHERGSTPS